jgi:hypothetical protein
MIWNQMPVSPKIIKRPDNSRESVGEKERYHHHVESCDEVIIMMSYDTLLILDSRLYRDSISRLPIQ